MQSALSKSRSLMWVVVLVGATGCPDPEGPPDGGQHDDAGIVPESDAGPGPTRDASVRDASSGDTATPGDAGESADAALADAGTAADAGTIERFVMRVVTQGLSAPWEITWGPDQKLWITERTGKRVLRVDPSTGSQTTALTVADAYQSAGQDGVLGLALHPRLLTGSGEDYVYLAYTYDADASAGVDRRAKLVRYSYDPGTQTLGSPAVLLSGLSASNDHNSGRLLYGPDEHLYYTIGDQGKNQFDNRCLLDRAQDLPTQAQVDARDLSTYEGKILRLGLDGSIPLDNPLLKGVRSHVYSYGHRNAQGLAFGPDGKLYADEQGPKTDDELNLIGAGKNYGWPQVAGYQDDRAYVYGNWSAASNCASLPYSDYVIPSSVPVQRESEWSSPDFTPPLKTFYTVDNNYDFTDPACLGNEFICWPTIAPSSLELYAPGSTGLTSWGRSLLLTSLKEGSVFRVRLSADGSETVGEPVALFKTTNRYRDLTVAPDQRTFYVVTDSEGSTSGPTSGSTQQLEHRGAVLEFRYAP